MEELCKECGARYEIQKLKLPVYDKDRISCIYCGRILRDWNGRFMYCAKKISGPVKEKYNKSHKTSVH